MYDLDHIGDNLKPTIDTLRPTLLAINQLTEQLQPYFEMIEQTSASLKQFEEAVQPLLRCGDLQTRSLANQVKNQIEADPDSSLNKMLETFEHPDEVTSQDFHELAGKDSQVNDNHKDPSDKRACFEYGLNIIKQAVKKYQDSCNWKEHEEVNFQSRTKLFRIIFDVLGLLITAFSSNQQLQLSFAIANYTLQIMIDVLDD